MRKIMSRRQLMAGGFSSFAAASFVASCATAASSFKPVPTQFIAALADPAANSGTGAETWGLWKLDPGPRGVRLSSFFKLLANGKTAPAKWKFNPAGWWLDENAIIMEAPESGIAAGRYMVTGNRTVQTILTIFEKDASGQQRWELGDGASIYDVTHLRCRSARYTQSAGSETCTPANVKQSQFPVTPGAEMPIVQGCEKQDHAVLFIVGVEE